MAKNRKPNEDIVEEAAERVLILLAVSGFGWIEIVLPIILELIKKCQEKRSARNIEDFAKTRNRRVVEAVFYLAAKQHYRTEPDLSMDDFRGNGRQIAQAMYKAAKASKAGEITALCNAC